MKNLHIFMQVFPLCIKILCMHKIIKKEVLFMCTSIAFRDGKFLFGRNMDIDYHFNGTVTITPRNFPLIFRNMPEIKNHLALIGMTATFKENNFPLYCEATNEKGLCMAGLDFTGNAYYPPLDKSGVSPFEIIPFILSQCCNVQDAKTLIKNISLTDIPFRNDVPLTDLHWHIADKNSSIVVEPLRKGIKIYDNTTDVLTNNPPFDFHLSNLCNYMNLTPYEPKSEFSEKLGLSTYGKGLGSFGLPGDFSPSSRFIKAVFMNYCSKTENDSHITQFFHILDSVAMIRGSVVTKSDTLNITDYSCCMDTDNNTYYIKSFLNNRITAITMNEKSMNENCLISIPVNNSQDILHITP